MGLDDDFAFALKLLSEENCDDALLMLERITESAPQHERAWCARGACLLRKKNTEAALACFNRAISLDGDDYFPFQEKGKCLMISMNFKEAMALFATAVRLNGAGNAEDRENKADSLFLLAFAQMLMADNEAASASIEQAFGTDPSRTYNSVLLLFREIFEPSPQVGEAEKQEIMGKLDSILREVVRIDRIRKMKIRKSGS